MYFKIIEFRHKCHKKSAFVTKLIKEIHDKDLNG